MLPPTKIPEKVATAISIARCVRGRAPIDRLSVIPEYVKFSTKWLVLAPDIKFEIGARVNDVAYDTFDAPVCVCLPYTYAFVMA